MVIFVSLCTLLFKKQKPSSYHTMYVSEPNIPFLHYWRFNIKGKVRGCIYIHYYFQSECYEIVRLVSKILRKMNFISFPSRWWIHRKKWYGLGKRPISSTSGRGRCIMVKFIGFVLLFLCTVLLNADKKINERRFPFCGP